jgi:glutamate racemase
MDDPRPIGIFDSGLGGLSVLKEVRRQLPDESIIYFADQGHLPYGPRTLSEVRHFSEAITRFLLSENVKVVVIACNTASAAALAYLRQTFPNASFVGMEPAVKPAAQRSQRRVIGVIATAATFQGELFASVVDRFAQGVTVLTQACPELVTQVEAGELDTLRTRELAQAYLDPLIRCGIDSLVLGCTHFSFLTSVIARIVGPEVEIVDPAPAVARQVGRVISRRRSSTTVAATPKIRAYTSGEANVSRLASVMAGEAIDFQTKVLKF